MGKLTSMLALLWLRVTMDPKLALKDPRSVAGTVDPGHWLYLVIILIILFAVIAATYKTFYANLAPLGNYSSNPFGTAFVTIVTLLFFAALLISMVVLLLHRSKKGGSA